MEKNPFLEKDEDDEEEKEEPYVVPKPFKQETLTEAQKRRNLKGIKTVQEDLKKIVPLRVL